MSREIKFRAWNTVTEKMMLWDDIKKFGNLNKLISLNHVRVQQYTGLKDKNGVDIYEGDKVKVCNNNKGFFEVVFVTAYVGGWVLKHKDLDIISLGARKETDVEVIGNIHSNPELS